MSFDLIGSWFDGAAFENYVQLWKNYLCSQFAFLFSTKAVIPSFRSFVPKDACKTAAWANLTIFYAIQEFCYSLLPQLMAQFNSDLWQTKRRILREHGFAAFTWNILFSNLSPSFRVNSAAAFVDSLAIATAIWDNQHFCWDLCMGWLFSGTCESPAIWLAVLTASSTSCSTGKTLATSP